MSSDVKAQRDDEIFDVVDENDQVIGQATRAEVHRRKLWHRAIHVWVFNAAGRIFLQKRSLLKDMAPGCWDSSCSGHLDSGEDYATAAVRELGEEIGLFLAEAPERLFTEKAIAATGWEFVSVFQLKHEGPFELHPAEIDEGRWFNVEEVDAMIESDPASMAPAFQHLWNRRATTGSKSLSPNR
ncbi:NUDIX hydrolase [Synoicihabitans lomoniglobus]|uniref:NUDIX domain-containing protein n=1 Tax=Synoicihabitans lomoniglobus TaxID=2909285 RepID=A0AAF0CQ86_9BACT|nr:NUDIX domain-containing protein [Opitutaceae bacterium LMO-M01]WED66068.1 NUDIX domain-containing protein [Opitutaceae bacterium LMO-M01]